MTKRDFEMIAGILADAESRIETDADCSKFSDEQTHYASEILDMVIENFIRHIEPKHPRFNAGLFKSASRPIRAYRLKQAILAKLAQQ